MLSRDLQNVLMVSSNVKVGDPFFKKKISTLIFFFYIQIVGLLLIYNYTETTRY